MRKNNDGYVIIYVVFVLVFLCIVAVSVCSVSLSNLQTQTAQTQQLQSKYAAMGEIEKFMAEVCSTGENVSNKYSLIDATNEAKNLFCQKLTNMDDNRDVISCVNGEWNESESINYSIESYELTVKADNVKATVIINVSYNAEASYKPEDLNGDNVIEEGEQEFIGYDVTIEPTTAQYTSFEIGGAA